MKIIENLNQFVKWTDTIQPFAAAVIVYCSVFIPLVVALGVCVYTIVYWGGIYAMTLAASVGPGWLIAAASLAIGAAVAWAWYTALFRQKAD